MNYCPKGYKMGGIEIECPYTAEMRAAGGEKNYGLAVLCLGNASQCQTWRDHLEIDEIKKRKPRGVATPEEYLVEQRRRAKKSSSGICKMWEVPCIDALDDERICFRPVTECEMWCKELDKLKKENQLRKGRHIELGEEDE